MGAWSSTTAGTTWTLPVHGATTDSFTNHPWPRPVATYEGPSAFELKLMLDDFLREIARIVACWRVLHELLMQQEDRRTRARPPPAGVPPDDIVRARSRPPPRAPPKEDTRGPT